jgi:glycosyltransferase involved in cell wall biosynthesis
MLLKWFSFPHRRWFACLHGNEKIVLDAVISTGSGIAAFKYSDSIWQPDEMASFLRSTDARWILWHDGEFSEGVADMLALFEDQQTFAVARQVDYRAWNHQILPTAPFRRLQPDEATYVIAPVSRALLVDRQKLAALGIPWCTLAGTAWMVLFWKAAAAGWRCYCIGHQREIGSQPDRPMEESSFFLHVLRRTALRRLGPAEPLLGSGNIAFQAARHHPSCPTSGRLRVLVVSPFLPFPLAHGGAVRIYNLCRTLSERVDFALIAIREKDEIVDYNRLHDVFQQVRTVDLDSTGLTDPTLPFHVRHYHSRSLRELIADMARTWKPDVLQIEYTQMAGYGNCAPGVPSLLVEHDLTFNLHRQLAELRNTGEAWEEYKRWHVFECEWLRSFHGVWNVSEEERLASIRESSRSPQLTFTIPNGVDVERFQPRESSTTAPELLYVGSFRHLPNLIGFEALRTQVMPQVWKRHPKTHLRVVAGPRHQHFWRQFGGADASRTIDPRIEILDFVSDLRPMYARAAAVAVPLVVSAGTNIKVLEAMACGKAIVSTGRGCAGLELENGRELLICEDWSGFAGAISEVLGDRNLRQYLGQSARQTAEDRFDWKTIAEKAWQSYQTLSGIGIAASAISSSSAGKSCGVLGTTLS